MISFTQYLTESKDRIINKMPLLSYDEKKELISFFKKHPNYENKIDWNKWKKLKFSDFSFALSTKSKRSKKKALKHKGISGLKEGEDYVHVKLKSKDYLAYIPLTWEASRDIASKYIANCEGKWCIAYSKQSNYWVEYVIQGGQVPVYVVSDSEKWAVMIHEGNRQFDVWNAKDDIVDDDDIPNFDVKRELLTSKLKNLYDDIRQDVYANDENSMKEIDDERKALFDFIREQARLVITNYNDYEEKVITHVNDITSMWEAYEFDTKTIVELYQERLDDVTAAIGQTDNDFDTASFENQLYTRVELRIFQDKIRDAVELAQENYNEWDWDEVFEDLEDIKDYGAPLDEEDHEELFDRINDYDLVKFGLRPMIDWEDVYDENYNAIETGGYGGTDYDTYFNYSYESYGGNMGSFVDDANEFISEAFLDPRTGNKKRTSALSDEEIYPLFEQNDMY